MKFNKTLAIGIPTYEGGISLVKTVNSILGSDYNSYISSIVIVVDGKKLKKGIVEQLTNRKIRIIQKEKRKGQSTRINDIFNALNTDNLILTNDDILFREDTIKKIVEKYLKYDLVACNVWPRKSGSLFEKILETGQKIRLNSAQKWKNGNNYLSCNGRLIVLSKHLYKKVQIPEKVWNNDAFIYIQSQILHDKFVFAPNVVAYYTSPTSWKEHLSQSAKFQKSSTDLQRYFDFDISDFYNIPRKIKIMALLNQFFRSPVSVTLYIAIFVGTRIKGALMSQAFMNKGFWETDLSTKILNLL